MLRSPAGTGKTFATDAAREACERSDVAVFGCALSARAACELREQAGIQASTIVRLTRELDGGGQLPRGSALIVDEAGMVGTRDLVRLIAAAEVAGAKLVLVGDDRQLPEIEAAGLFAALADRLGALELKEVRRQREPWDRDALAALRGGDVDRFAREYGAHGRIVAATTAQAARERLVRDWLEAHERGERALMIAHRRRDVADLNRRAREIVRAAGRIGPNGLVTDSQALAVGDRVIARRNDQRLGVVNGDVGCVTAIGGGRSRFEADDRRPLDLPEGQRLIQIDAGLRAVQQRRDRLRWHQRAGRRELDRTAGLWQRERTHFQREVTRLTAELEHRSPTRGAPPDHERRRGRDLGMGLETMIHDAEPPRGLTRAALMTAREVAELLDVPVSTSSSGAATAPCRA